MTGRVILTSRSGRVTTRPRYGTHPALRRRRLHRVHTLPSGHGRPPVDAPPTPLAGRRRDQRRGRARHRHGAARRRRLEVHDRRLGAGGRHPAAREPPTVDPAPLRPGPARGPRPARAKAPSVHPHGGGPGRLGQQGTLNGLQYARTLAPDRLIALSVVGDPEEQRTLSDEWYERSIPVELHTSYSPYRELTRPVLSFLDDLDAEDPDDIITVVIPEFVVSTWYTQVLHNQTALALKARLLFRPHTVVPSVPVHVD